MMTFRVAFCIMNVRSNGRLNWKNMSRPAENTRRAIYQGRRPSNCGERLPKYERARHRRQCARQSGRHQLALCAKAGGLLMGPKPTFASPEGHV
jgi:hypothetical protein